MPSTSTAAEPTEVVGIRFQKLGKLYHFRLAPDQQSEVIPGDYVVVETKKGKQLGQVIAFVTPEEVSRRRSLRTVDRKATPRDLVLQQVWNAKELDALITCREKAHETGVRDTKFIKAAYSFDGSWLTVFYTTENKAVNLRGLRSTLSRQLRARVELQVIGPRDVAKIMGGYGACGAPRCCSTFLTEFSPISIRMAKAQGISLSPQEITGMCGRLRCCLVYEYEQYVEAKKQLPKRGKRVGTPYGEGVVRDQLPLKDMARVVVDGQYYDVPREELEPLDEQEALRKKAEAGCSKHENGGCDCGAGG
jgi:cell fate regulator YaaT (PSP1 superfamily)